MKEKYFGKLDSLENCCKEKLQKKAYNEEIKSIISRFINENRKYLEEKKIDENELASKNA